MGRDNPGLLVLAQSRALGGGKGPARDTPVFGDDPVPALARRLPVRRCAGRRPRSGLGVPRVLPCTAAGGYRAVCCGSRVTGSPPGQELHLHRLRVVRNRSSMVSATDPPGSPRQGPGFSSTSRSDFPVWGRPGPAPNPARRFCRLPSARFSLPPALGTERPLAPPPAARRFRRLPSAAIGVRCHSSGIGTATFARDAATGMHRFLRLPTARARAMRGTTRASGRAGVRKRALRPMLPVCRAGRGFPRGVADKRDKRSRYLSRRGTRRTSRMLRRVFATWSTHCCPRVGGT
jgi:hypothetical protein